jgi:hypothetical protein
VGDKVDGLCGLVVLAAFGVVVPGSSSGHLDGLLAFLGGVKVLASCGVGTTATAAVAGAEELAASGVGTTATAAVAGAEELAAFGTTATAAVAGAEELAGAEEPFPCPFFAAVAGAEELAGAEEPFSCPFFMALSFSSSKNRLYAGPSTKWAQTKLSQNAYGIQLFPRRDIFSALPASQSPVLIHLFVVACKSIGLNINVLQQEMLLTKSAGPSL